MSVDQLPPFPLWSCMVQSTLEFCRVTWDLGRIQRHFVNMKWGTTIMPSIFKPDIRFYFKYA
jgi:hypothetical protein